MDKLVRISVTLWLVWAGAAQADMYRDVSGRQCSSGEWSHMECIRPTHFAFDTCQMIRNQSRVHGLDEGFFARLIWHESRFDPNALSHADAMGIAQFIGSTAKLRGLENPYNPAEALEHSAEYLGEMQRKYGNPGLAAVGYNGGEGRAQGLIAGTGGLATETVNYVQIITGLTAETWRDQAPETHDFRLAKDRTFMRACLQMAASRKLSPMRVKPVEPAIKKWGVQVAYGNSPAQARAAYTRRVQSCSSAVAGETPDYVFVKHRASLKKGYYMARIGRNTRRAAADLCQRIRRAGCLCQTYKNY
ncbi:MAG: lytic transglycosylase domain-containing protein [Shimia sp.]